MFTFALHATVHNNCRPSQGFNGNRNQRMIIKQIRGKDKKKKMTMMKKKKEKEVKKKEKKEVEER